MTDAPPIHVLIKVDGESYRHYLAILDQLPSGEGFVRLMSAPKPWLPFAAEDREMS